MSVEVEKEMLNAIFAASLPLIRLEVSNGDFRFVIEGIHEKLILHVQCSQCFLVKLNPFIGQTPGFFDCSIVAGEGSKGGELRRPI